MANSEAIDAEYTVFIRLPFPREDFVDPPPVDWDATKDKALWKILSNTSKNANTDWGVLAKTFDVSLPFMLQQAAWLYERQLSQVRAQMRRVGASKTSLQSPTTGTESTGGETMKRTASGGGGGGENMERAGSGGGSGGDEAMKRASSGGGGGSRVPSSSSPHADSPIARGDTSSPTATPGNAPPLNRTSSANTVKVRVRQQISPRLAKASLHHPLKSPSNIRLSPLTLTSGTGPPSKSKDASSSEAAQSSSSDSSSDSEPAQSRLLRRPPRFSTHRLSRAADADDGDDDTPAFLPIPATVGASNMQPDPSATLRGELQSTNRRNSARKSMEVAQKSQTSDSSNSSAAPPVNPNQKGHNHAQKPPGPLSPRRTAELSGQRASSKGKNVGRESSDGTPSMGSSFSDLDDASVTQSALEEALASNMKQGGMASRMSTISQALRSRYL